MLSETVPLHDRQGHHWLGRLLDNCFVLVHMTGMRQSKQEFQRCIANGTLNYYSCNDIRLDIKVNGRQANCTGKSEVNAAVFGGKRHTWNLQLDIDFRKEDWRWLMTKATASVY